MAQSRTRFPTSPSTSQGDGPYSRPHLPTPRQGPGMSPAAATPPAVSSGWSQGTTVTAAPRSHRHRTWLYLRPQSTAVMRSDPPGLNTQGVCGRGERGLPWPPPRLGPALHSKEFCSASCPPAIPTHAPNPTFSDTSCTRCRLLGSSKARLFSGVPSGTSFPSSVPFSRIFFVRARVSTPADSHET